MLKKFLLRSQLPWSATNTLFVRNIYRNFPISWSVHEFHFLITSVNISNALIVRNWWSVFADISLAQFI